MNMHEKADRKPVTKIPEGAQPKIVPARDASGNTFEGYLLRRAGGSSIVIDRYFVDAMPGGICAFRNGISPHFDIVCEVLI